MNRQILVMRHAKSSWKQLGMTDHQRPLNERGRLTASQMARYLADVAWTPDKIIASDAQRTRETAQLLQAIWQIDDIVYSPTFYLAGIEAVRDTLQREDPRLQSVLLLGHNPGWQEVVHWLTGETVTLKTASTALLSCTSPTWEKSMDRAGQWRLIRLVHPSEIDGGRIDENDSAGK